MALEHVVKIIGDDSQFRKAMDDAGDALGEFGVDLDKIKKMLSGPAGLTMAFAAVAAAGLEAAKAYDEASSIIAKSTGATGDKLDELNNSLRSIMSSGVEQGLDEIAGAMASVSKRFGESGEKLEETTKLFATFADVTNQKTTGAVRNVSEMMRKWGIEANKLPEILDKLTKAGTLSEATAEELTATLTQSGAALQTMGFSLEESMALLASFKQNGVDAQQSMMAFNTAIAYFADKGIDARTGLEDLAEQVRNAATETDAARIAADAFGTRAGTNMALAIRSGAMAIGDFTSEIQNSKGAVDSMDVASQTMGDRLAVISNNIQANLGQAFEPFLRAGATVLDIVNTLLGAFNSLPGPVKEGVLAFGALTVGFRLAGQAAVALGRTLPAAFGPIGLAVAAVVGLVSALGGLSAAWEEQKWNEQADGVKAVAKEMNLAKEESIKLGQTLDAWTYKFTQSYEAAKDMNRIINEESKAAGQTREEYIKMYEIDQKRYDMNSMGLDLIETIMRETGATRDQAERLVIASRETNDELKNQVQSLRNIRIEHERVQALIQKDVDAYTQYLRCQEAGHKAESDAYARWDGHTDSVNRQNLTEIEKAKQKLQLSEEYIRTIESAIAGGFQLSESERNHLSYVRSRAEAYQQIITNLENEKKIQEELATERAREERERQAALLDRQNREAAINARAQDSYYSQIEIARQRSDLYQSDIDALEQIRDQNGRLTADQQKQLETARAKKAAQDDLIVESEQMADRMRDQIAEEQRINNERQKQLDAATQAIAKREEEARIAAEQAAAEQKRQEEELKFYDDRQSISYEMQKADLEYATQQIALREQENATVELIGETQNENWEDQKASLDEAARMIEERDKAEQDAIERKKEAEKNLYDEQKRWNEKLAEDQKKRVKELVDGINQGIELVKDIMSAVSDLQQSEFDKQISNVDSETQKKLEAAGLQEETDQQRIQRELDAAIQAGDTETANKKKNELAKFEIEKEAEKKKSELKFQADTKRWETELAMLAVNTAGAIIRAYVDLGPIFGSIATAGILTVSALQLATMLNNKPTPPAFEQGTQFAPGGMALVGERGPEIVNLPQGSEVRPNWAGGAISGGLTVHIHAPVDADAGTIARAFRKEMEAMAI